MTEHRHHWGIGGGIAGPWLSCACWQQLTAARVNDLEAVAALMPKALEYIKGVAFTEMFGHYPDAAPDSLAKDAVADRAVIEAALRTLRDAE